MRRSTDIHCLPQSDTDKICQVLSRSLPQPVLRIAVGAILVLLDIRFAGSLGPRLSGMLNLFRVLSSVLAVFCRRLAGVPALG